VPKESKLHCACAYLPCEANATISVKNKHGWINVCLDHYERWIDDGKEEGPRPNALEDRAREVARKFGVDENLSPRDRCMAIARAFTMRGGIGGGYRTGKLERIPGEDDE
jgi:hypothetical protein